MNILPSDFKSSPKVKRGRGRPRKSQNLEEDLQFSSDEDDFEEVVSDQDQEATNLLNQGEMKREKFKEEGKDVLFFKFCLISQLLTPLQITLPQWMILPEVVVEAVRMINRLRPLQRPWSS